ncbi:hypothetical protein HID58_088858 [Brassica napus]|uniref:Hexosyltransferase n=1 Tax=Brassica napus TaxID=3708 RepID=A0ABQ7XXC6_BRANA|nr:hypothetical protein HID58_088858 [Brassica napus]
MVAIVGENMAKKRSRTTCSPDFKLLSQMIFIIPKKLKAGNGVDLETANGRHNFKNKKFSDPATVTKWKDERMKHRFKYSMVILEMSWTWHGQTQICFFQLLKTRQFGYGELVVMSVFISSILTTTHGLMFQQLHEDNAHHLPSHTSPPSCPPHLFYGKRRRKLHDQQINDVHGSIRPPPSNSKKPDHDEDNLSDDGSHMMLGGTKKRLNLEQVKALEKIFELGNKLEPERKMQLGKALGQSSLKETLKKQFDVLKSDNDSLLAHNKKLHDGFHRCQSSNLGVVGTDGAARNIFFVGSIAFQDVAHKVFALKVFLNRGDMARLKEIQEAVLQMSAPKALRNELIHKLRSERMSYHGDESSWNRSWVAIKKLWASKWNVRAYVSRKLELTHDAICMSVLVQESCGDYAFVIHTNNPVTGDPSEIHTRDCEGFGRDLGWRISRTSNELYHQENKPQLANRDQ